jgi:hypothetical protein
MSDPRRCPPGCRGIEIGDGNSSGCECPGDGCDCPQHPAPHVEVTERVGEFRKYDHCAIVSQMPPDGHDGYTTLDDLLPAGAYLGGLRPGPRGRYRVTVEFWPEPTK